MTESEKDLCRGLVRAPGIPEISIDDFKRSFPAAVSEGVLNPELLADAVRRKSGSDLDWVMLIGHSIGFTQKHLPLLCPLVMADWHCRHESVVSALNKIGSDEACEALFNATQWIPQSLDYDDSRTLASKAIWALGNLRTKRAIAYLQQLQTSSDPILKREAEEQLKRIEEERASN